MTRKEAIETLKKLIEAMQGHVTVLPSPERIVAIRVAISSLETDEAYQLEYEYEKTKALFGKIVKEEDCISRQAVLELLEDTNNGWIINEVLHLPPVTPQEPKTGHWIEEFNDLEGEVRFTCSCCGKYQLFGTDFCYNCGAKMVEPQESEDKG